LWPRRWLSANRSTDCDQAVKPFRVEQLPSVQIPESRTNPHLKAGRTNHPPVLAKLDWRLGVLGNGHWSCNLAKTAGGFAFMVNRRVTRPLKPGFRPNHGRCRPLKSPRLSEVRPAGPPRPFFNKSLVCSFSSFERRRLRRGCLHHTVMVALHSQIG
jgi:hypothetical protein